jgi:hydroxypyruvate reductase
VTPLLVRIFEEVTRRIDGGRLVREGLAAAAPALVEGGEPLHVLALGKVAVPMLQGLLDVVGDQRVRAGLAIAPRGRLGQQAALPPAITVLPGDHPTPSEGSLAAGAAARALVAGLAPDAPLVVLLSGGGSSLAVLPADGLDLEDKRAATAAVARAGASIHQLNAVRKHLSALKGGQLALATRARVTVLALSDVVGNDPGTIASGPFSPDPTTFAEARELVARLAPQAPAPVVDRLDRGAAGLVPETPKPGDPRLAHVRFELLAGPARVPAEARQLVEAAGLAAGLLARDTERPVAALAEAYGERARREAEAGGRARVLIGNGEPSIVVTGEGRGGRSTHLALLMARELAGLPGVAFLAAGTDDRDGNTDSAGAVVDGTTWAKAVAAGLEPEAALAACDSERPLRALGCLIAGPGTSNLLDLHLLAVDRPASG